MRRNVRLMLFVIEGKREQVWNILIQGRMGKSWYQSAKQSNIVKMKTDISWFFTIGWRQKYLACWYKPLEEIHCNNRNLHLYAHLPTQSSNMGSALKPFKSGVWCRHNKRNTMDNRKIYWYLVHSLTGGKNSIGNTSLL